MVFVLFSLRCSYITTLNIIGSYGFHCEIHVTRVDIAYIANNTTYTTTTTATYTTTTIYSYYNYIYVELQRIRKFWRKGKKKPRERNWESWQYWEFCGGKKSKRTSINNKVLST